MLADFLTSSMGDLLAFQGYENATAPFNWNEYGSVYNSDRVYHDFQPGNDWNSSCEYPRMWGEDGFPLPTDITQDIPAGCKASEFDQVFRMVSPLIALADWPSMETLKASEPSPAMKLNSPNLRLFRIGCVSGTAVSSKRSKSCHASRLPC